MKGVVTDSTRQRQGWRGVHRQIARECEAAGLDLAEPLQVGWYNRVVEPDLRIPDFGRPGSLAIVIGNTRAIWPHLLRALHVDRTLFAGSDPVERFAEEVVERARSRSEIRSEVRWSHTVGERMVAMQRLAHVGGLAYLSPVHLSVHPLHGPWIALRAVVVLDVTGPAGDPPIWRSPCDACEQACVPVMRSLAARPSTEVSPLDWVAVRDACPIGRGSRYSAEQIEYHYVKDVRWLRELVRPQVVESGAG